MKILYVCSGNINRSAVAKYISNVKYSDNHSFDSAGTSKKSVGKRMTKKMKSVLKFKFNVNALGHWSKSVSKELISWADVIVCFSDVHVNSLNKEFDLKGKKIIKLWEYYHKKIDRIIDPGTNSDVEVAKKAFGQILVCLEVLFNTELNMNQFTFFDEFNEKRKSRLEMGVKKYGDALLNKDDLVVDVEEELLDIANYSYLMYCRLKKLESIVDNKVRNNK